MDSKKDEITVDREIFEKMLHSSSKLFRKIMEKHKNGVDPISQEEADFANDFVQYAHHVSAQLEKEIEQEKKASLEENGNKMASEQNAVQIHTVVSSQSEEFAQTVQNVKCDIDSVTQEIRELSKQMDDAHTTEEKVSIAAKASQRFQDIIQSLKATHEVLGGLQLSENWNDDSDNLLKNALEQQRAEINKLAKKFSSAGL